MKTFTAKNIFVCEDDIRITKENALYSKTEPHVHEFIELVYIRSGEGRQVVNGRVYEVRAGDLLFINYGQTHAVQNAEMEFVNILLKPGFMSEKLVNSENIFAIFALSGFSSAPEEYALELASFRGGEYAAVDGIVDVLLTEYAAKREGYRTVIYGYMQVLFTMMIRKLKERGSAHSQRFISDIIGYIDLHALEPISLSDIAAGCFYNPSYFSRKFKEYYGKSLTEYIREKRLAEAIRLLNETDMTVTEISCAAGFSDRSLFHKTFKKYCACTPEEYRKKVKNNH